MPPRNAFPEESLPALYVESVEFAQPAAPEETGEPVPYAVIWKDGEEMKLY